VDTVIVELGQTFDAYIALDDFTNAQGFEFDLTYTGTVLSYVEAAPTTFWGDTQADPPTLFCVTPDLQPGQVDQIACTRFTPLTFSAQLRVYRVRFTPIARGVGFLNLINGKVADGSTPPLLLPFSITQGGVYVNNRPRITGAPLTPISARTTDTLTAAPTAVDDEGDQITATEVRWEKDGVRQDALGTATLTINPSLTLKGEEWVYFARASDITIPLASSNPFPAGPAIAMNSFSHESISS